MRSRIAVSLLFILIAAIILKSDGAAAFAKLKALQGCGRTTGPSSRVVQLLNHITSDAVALINEVRGDENKLAMIRLDGDRLMLTRSASTGTQPRVIETVSPDGKTITLSVFDAANLLSSPEAHVQRIVFNLIDSDHHRESLDFTIGDIKQLMHESLDLHRSK
jgi:hypothetical protein